MGLLPKPHVTLTDADVADALCRAVAIIDPLLDLLAESDVTGLRRRTHRLLTPPRHLTGLVRRIRVRRRRRAAGRTPGVADRARNTGAHLLNAAAMPGTAAWDRMDRDERVHWWVHRVGGLNTLAVASPGAFGWLTRVLPVSDLAGFVNDAIILCAVGREYGVTERREQVRLLATVLCRRPLPEDFDLPAVQPEPLPETPPPGFRPLAAFTSSTPVVIARTVWQLAGTLRALFEETGKRPHPNKAYRWLSALPAVGAVATYLGERAALRRVAREGVAWLDVYTTGNGSPGLPPTG